MSVRDYQCWPDGEGRAYLRHKCKAGYITMLLPKGRWHFDGQKVTPSVNCGDCGFHMMVEKTHDQEPTHAAGMGHAGELVSTVGRSNDEAEGGTPPTPAAPSQEGHVGPATREWVTCPVCGDTDMEQLSDSEGNKIIHCSNHACASNGGKNAQALRSLSNAAAQAEQEQCPNCGGSGRIALGENFVSREMALDAGEPAMEGQSMGIEYGRCQECHGDGVIQAAPSQEGGPGSAAPIAPINAAGQEGHAGPADDTPCKHPEKSLRVRDGKMETFDPHPAAPSAPGAVSEISNIPYDSISQWQWKGRALSLARRLDSFRDIEKRERLLMERAEELQRRLEEALKQSKDNYDRYIRAHDLGIEAGREARAVEHDRAILLDNLARDEDEYDAMCEKLEAAEQRLREQEGADRQQGDSAPNSTS